MKTTLLKLLQRKNIVFLLLLFVIFVTTTNSTALDTDSTTAASSPPPLLTIKRQTFALRHRRLANDEEAEACMICLEKFERNEQGERIGLSEEAMYADCGHHGEMHEACTQRWIAQRKQMDMSPKCAKCRTPLILPSPPPPEQLAYHGVVDRRDPATRWSNSGTERQQPRAAAARTAPSGGGDIDFYWDGFISNTVGSAHSARPHEPGFNSGSQEFNLRRPYYGGRNSELNAREDNDYNFMNDLNLGNPSPGSIPRRPDAAAATEDVHQDPLERSDRREAARQQPRDEEEYFPQSPVRAGTYMEAQPRAATTHYLPYHIHDDGITSGQELGDPLSEWPFPTSPGSDP